MHSVPEDFALEVAFALGRKGDVSQRLKDTCEIDQ
jgi:hypothetical protein